MECPKCKAQVEEDQLFCHVCGEELVRKFKTEIPEEAEETQNEQQEQEATLAEDAVESDEQSEAQAEEETAETEQIEPQQADEEEVPKQTETAAQEAPKPAIVKKSTKKEDKKTKAYTVAMKTIVLVCAAVMVVLAVLSKTTQIFKNDNSDKTVVLSGLNDAQKASFEDFASKYNVFFENGYNSQNSVFDDVLELINPSDENGLYALKFGKPTATVDTPDPANRFADENGTYSYFELDAKNISQIAKELSLKALDDSNTADYYFLGGKYYFAQKVSAEKGEAFTLKVEDAKKTNDGGYYITCDLLKNGSEQAEKQLYFIAAFEENGSDYTWTISRISTEAIYSPLGSKLPEKSDENAVSFVMKRKTIEAKTSDGKVYQKYIVEYPSFETSSVTGSTINTKYADLVSQYKKEAEKADKNYKKFIENGGDETALPLYTHISVSVKYNENGNLSMVERKTVYNPSAKNDNNEVYQTASLFPETTYEAHSFEIETGEFLKKDDLVGKDYQAVEQALYEKLIGWEAPQEAISPVHPTDANSAGQAIYSSAWYITGDMVNFLYQHTDGALEIVSIPVTQAQSELGEETTTGVTL